MRTIYFTHACFQLTTAQGVRLLCDPWTFNPVGQAWWQFPETPFGPQIYADQDVLYISHNHVDHFCWRTLEYFDRNLPIVLRAYGEHNNPIRPTLETLGFRNLIELKHGETRQILGDLEISLYADPATFDSAVVISDGRYRVFNQNDCMMPLDIARQIGREHKVDLALLGLPASSIYPTFFVMDPALKLSETEMRKQKVMARTSDYAEAIGAPFVIPCAADMINLRTPDADLYLGPLPIEFQVDARARGRAFDVVAMSPGDCFDLASPGKNYKPTFASLDDMRRAVAGLREEPRVRAVFAEIEAWERGFGYDRAELLRQMDGFAEHLNDRFATLLAGQLASTGPKTFRVRFVLTDQGEAIEGFDLDLDLGAHRFAFRSAATADLGLSDHDMALVMPKECIGMMMAGAMQFDDLRGGWIEIHRPGPFTPEEVAFWHVMMVFGAWQTAQGLVTEQPRFAGQISLVFNESPAAFAKSAGQ